MEILPLSRLVIVRHSYLIISSAGRSSQQSKNQSYPKKLADKIVVINKIESDFQLLMK